MIIRHTTIDDLDVVMEIYKYARSFMAQNGNPNQWGTLNPRREQIEKDIENGVSYVCEDEEGIQAVFAFLEGIDPTYSLIENGEWINDEPYGTIHRIASAGKVKGTASFVFDWCFNKCGNVRADTHEDNKIMQHLLVKNRFKKCGVIYLANGSPRIAFQKTIP